MTFYLWRIFGIAAIAVTPVCAQDNFDIPVENLPSSVSLEGGGDAVGSRNLTLYGDVGLASGIRVRAGYAGARVDTAAVSYDGKTYWAGLNSDPLALFSYGGNYEIMRRDDGIRSGAIKTHLRWRLNDWRLMLYPELRSITLTKKRITQKNVVRSVATTIRSPGLGAAVTFNGLEDWSFALRHFVYRYDTDAQTLRSHPVFAQQAFAYVDQSFDAARSAVNVDYAPSWGSAGLEVTRSQSAIDHELTRSTALNLSWDVSHAWTTFAHMGRSRADGVAATGFASIGVTWMWD